MEDESSGRVVEGSDTHGVSLNVASEGIAGDGDGDWDYFRHGLEEHPEEISLRPEGRHYPLFYMLTEASPPPPLDLVRRVYEMHPDALFEEIDFMGERFDNIVRYAVTFNDLHETLHAEALRFLMDKLPPDVASTKDRHGRVLLHYANQPEVAEILVEAFPEGLAVRDKGGDVPLHGALFRGPPGVVEVLVRAGWEQHVGGPRGGGGVFLPSGTGVSPLSSVTGKKWAVWARGGSDGEEREERFDRYWKTLSVVARAAYSAAEGRDEICPGDESTLFCLLGVGDIVEIDSVVLDLVASREPEALVATNGFGMTPLHVAAASPVRASTIQWLLKHRNVRGLVDKVDAMGRLPLHLAAKSGLVYVGGIELIVDVDKTALGALDPVENMYPFMLAAICERPSIETIYALLRDVPFLIQFYVQEEECVR